MRFVVMKRVYVRYLRVSLVLDGSAVLSPCGKVSIVAKSQAISDMLAGYIFGVSSLLFIARANCCNYTLYRVLEHVPRCLD